MKNSILGLEGVNLLSREQQKNVFGGLVAPVGPGGYYPCTETPTNKCTTDAECKDKNSSSYCYQHGCYSGGTLVKYNSCQFVRD